MSCTNLRKATKALNRFTADGKGVVIFGEHKNHEEYYDFYVPCGQCHACRLDHSRSWALRCMHESQSYESNAYLTLTYNQENIPEGGSLSRGKKSDFTLFMKRLRKQFPGKVLRYLQCGEYGDLEGRPHHHAIVFGLHLDDLVLKKVVNGNPVYISEKLDSIWKKGYCTVGDVTMETAAYVARYVTKKVTGLGAAEHYVRYDDDKEEHYYIESEFATMSRRPGLGYDWFQRYWRDCFPKDYVTYNGVRFGIPGYYMDLLEKKDPEMWLRVIQKRKEQINLDDPELSLDRRQVRAGILKRKFKKYSNRGIDYVE